jgi:hypothetical protein
MRYSISFNVPIELHFDAGNVHNSVPGTFPSHNVPIELNHDAGNVHNFETTEPKPNPNSIPFPYTQIDRKRTIPLNSQLFDRSFHMILTIRLCSLFPSQSPCPLLKRPKSIDPDLVNSTKYGDLAGISSGRGRLSFVSGAS